MYSIMFLGNIYRYKLCIIFLSEKAIYYILYTNYLRHKYVLLLCFPNFLKLLFYKKKVDFALKYD